MAISIAYYLEYIEDKTYQNPINLANWLCNDYHNLFLFDDYDEALNLLKEDYSDNYDNKDYKIYTAPNKAVILEIF